MQAALESFLGASELDELAALRDEITTIDRAEAAELSEVVRKWSDPQAIANLLLYPELIPPRDRLPSLLRGLRAGADDYFSLAAVVGLQRLEDDEEEIPSASRPEIVEQLVRLVEHGVGPIPARAALSVNTFAEDGEAAVFLRLLDHPDPVVRHNVLSGLVSSLGPAQLIATADAEVAAGRLSADAANALRASLAEADLDLDDEEVDEERVLDSPLGLPLLTPIPNYLDWREAIDDSI